MADTLHHLSLLHGNRPSVFEVVAQSALVPAPEWLNAAMRAFAGERDLMSRLMVAAGPPPSRDRKIVVWGKSVSVRVGLGGRRIIKKNNNNTDRPNQLIHD